MKKQLVTKLTVFDGGDSHVIRVYVRAFNSGYEIRLDNEFWCICESGNEVNDEIADIISLYNYTYFPMI